ncbi:hypothetical protein BGX28_008301 [Mortierella sp. GBA30]|nr:hypothetical protein BGX28_008301 [Mortierella sp. GBA30]
MNPSPPPLPLHLKQNPLDLPEIITRIGQFLPLWSGEGFHREFDPKPILRCLLVSRSFRASLLPILWYLYDGYRMRNVPPEILVKYSPYFRIITSTGPFKGPFCCRNLIELSTVYGQEWSRDLLISNPGLKRLVWGGPFHRRIETLEQQQEWELELRALMGLENLDEFRTSGFSLGEGIFVKVLRNNAARLSNLTLSTVAGVTSIEGLELPHLTELHLTLGCAESPALVDLVRCCPRLQRLSLMGSMANKTSSSPPAHMHQQLNPANNNNNNNNDNSLKDFEITRLARNIVECCPELSSIKFTTSSYPSIFPVHRSNGSQCFLSGMECALIVNAAHRLETFSADLLTLDYTLTEALVAHGPSLKSLFLSFYRIDYLDLSSDVSTNASNRTREAHCLRRLKASLYRLRELSLTWDESWTSAQATSEMMPEEREEVIAFLEEPWASRQDLSYVYICGMFPSVSTLSGGKKASLRASSDSKMRWRPSRTTLTRSIDRILHSEPEPEQETDTGCDGSVMLRALLVNIDPLTNLRHICVNRTAYERISNE